MTTIDPFFGEPEAPAAGPPPVPDIGHWPHGEPVVLEVKGDPVPWAVMQRNQQTGGRFVAPRQAKQAARIMAGWEATGFPKVPKPHGVVLGLTFTVERPKSHFRSGKNAHLLKEGAPDHPTGRPDLSNLVKLVEDALTTQAWDDDDQIVLLHDPVKRYSAQATTIIRIWLAPERASAPVALPGLGTLLAHNEGGERP